MDRNAGGVLTPDAVHRPFGPGGDDDLVGAEILHALGIKLTLQIEIDIGHLTDLVDAIIDRPAPFIEPRQAAFADETAARFSARIRKCHVMAALAQSTRGFEPGGPGADD